MLKKSLLAIATALTFAQATAAPVYSGSVPAGFQSGSQALAGNQEWGGMLGLNFAIKSGLFQLTHLGVFDDLANGLNRGIQVGLFERIGSSWSVVATTSFAAGTPNTSGGQFIYKALTGAPIVLDAGVYSIQASGYGSMERNFNTNFVPSKNNANGADTTAPITFNTFGGRLDNLDSVYRSSSALGGSTVDSGTVFFPSASTFGAGTLMLNEIPEPASLALFSLALLGAGAAYRRRRA